MLAAWMRMKFPHSVQGALAASAPIFYFKGALWKSDQNHEEEYYNIITDDFANTYTDSRCANGIREAFHDMNTIVLEDAKIWDDFSKVMKTCKPIDSK